MKKHIISQGTISVLFGCHSQIHSICIVIAWKHLYGRWPRPWELVCIILHDIGHIGRNYLDDPEEKAKHWRFGATIAGFFFGSQGYELCAGHSGHSGEPRSMLYKADKLSWTIAPIWWLYWQCIVEPDLNRRSEPIGVHIRKFRRWAENNCIGEWRETHNAVEELASDSDVG